LHAQPAMKITSTNEETV